MRSTVRMEHVGAVSSVWRYPVKSMMGDSFPSLPVDPGGVRGDRAWAVQDGARGGIRGAKKIGNLMRQHARYVDEPQPGGPSALVEITAPDGRMVRSDDDDVDARLSEFLDHPVTLCAQRTPADLDHYRRGAPDLDDPIAELRAMFGREPEEPLPTFAGLPLDVLVEYESPPGTYFDAFPIHVVTDRSLQTLASRTPGSVFDVRRFRPNLVLAVDSTVDGDYPEQTWLGRVLRVGDVELEITAACPRCVMVTREFGDLPADRDVLRTVVRDADQNVGVYANVVSSGTLATESPVTLS